MLLVVGWASPQNAGKLSKDSEDRALKTLNRTRARDHGEKEKGRVRRDFYYF